ncbi:K02A2.6-like, partial [Cordylochernes scorpioides]
MLNENLTLAKAVEIARQWEAVMREQQNLNPSTSQVDTTRKVAKQKPKARTMAGTNLCRRKNNEVNAISSEETPAREKASFVYAVREPTLGSRKSRWKSTVRVNGTEIHFKLDPGSDVTLIPFSLYKRYFSNVQLTPTDGQLMAAANQRLENAGTFVAKLRANTREMKDTVYVVHHLEQPLLGVGACEDLQLVRRIDRVINGTTDVNPEREFPMLFEGLGLLEQPFHIKLKEGAKPFSVPVPRRVHLPLMPKLKEQLDAMVAQEVIEPVDEPTEWCAPIVLAGKPNGKIRICVDLSRLNLSMERELHPLPVLEHELAQLNEAKIFSKLDANSGFWQIKLSEESQTLTTFITPFGRYKFKRLPFGISSAPEHFQKRMSAILRGINGKKAFEKVKDLASDRVLASFDISKKTMVSADASSYGLGAVLKQEHEANEWRPVAFASRTLTKTEQGYAQIEKEALAITWACERFKDFVVGKTFLIEPDHKPLVPIFTTKDLNDLTPRLQRYHMRMLQFSFHIFHTPGKDLITADALSRQPLPDHLPEDEELQEEGEEEQRKMAQKTAFDRRHAATKKAELIAGEKVWVKDLRAWGSAIEKASAPRSYIVETPVGTYRRNSLLLASFQQQVDPSETSPDSELPAEMEETPGNELPAEELQQQTAIAPEMKQLSPSPGKVSRYGRRYKHTCKITDGTTTPLTRNIETIHAIQPPHNRKTLRSFLGAVNVYKKFIPDYARLRTPLNNLLKKGVMWVWDNKCQKAFTSLKESLTTHPTLHLYQEGLPCQVYCDASTLGIAGVLKQVHPNGKTYLVQYFSRPLRSHERNYSISELECLAIVESVDKFRVYLMDRKFTIFSDHHALQWLKTIKNPSGRLFRWRLRLSSYEYEVRYIKGAQQYDADLLSRNPFCGFLDAPLIKSHQPSPSGNSKLTIDNNGLHTISRKGVIKIIIPKTLTNKLLQSVHKQYNHPGISKMTRLISAQYYWQDMSQDIAQKDKTCPTCQLTNRIDRPNQHLQRDIDTVHVHKLNPYTENIQYITPPKMDQKSGEAISKYIIRLKEQAQRCNFGDFLQESLRDRFVAGIIDTPTQKKLLQEEGLTFEGALDIALSAESADNDIHNLKRSEDAHRSPQHLHAINNPCKHCGRDFLNLFNISFNYLHKLDSFSIDSLLNDYESIFECKSDPIKGIKCHLDVRPDFISKFYKFRRVPFALKQLVENEIDKLVDLNILSPIDKSDCASPLVCVAKPNGQIRLCADFKKSLNPYLEDVKYPIPNIDSVLSNFQGKKLFTKLDMSKAYHQIEMDDISKKYLVVSTHKGLYKYNRLAFGIKTASEIFQKTMESFFSGIRDVYIYFDDILIASEDLESHLDILKRTLDILKENNFTINKNKCLFVKNEIEYLGHKINELAVDSFSSWVEVSEVPSTSAYFCIYFMRNCIARYGFPQVVVSDNGPPFFSSDFGDFLSKNGISHVTSPPYHPQSNGQAEVSVRE